MVRPIPSRPNAYAGNPLDRRHDRRSDEAWLTERLADPAARFVPVWRDRNLIREQPMPMPVHWSLTEVRMWLDAGAEPVFLGEFSRAAYFAVDLSQHAPDEPGHHEAAYRDLRAVGPLLGAEDGAILAYARAMAYWHQRHRFCGACGAPTRSGQAGHVRQCTGAACGIQHFPRTDPAVIMLVHDGDRIVLGRQKVWPPGMHSVLAGFVEPGESLEDAVAREVYEEIGVRVTEVHYHSSQPWPFPSSIMLGFWARAATTEIRVDPHELEDARWYDRAALQASPEDETFRLPRLDSIARRLVEDWMALG
ncbi:MAG: NAD(+) diphosphatase [Alphaproteobacteria bacterium]